MNRRRVAGCVLLILAAFLAGFGTGGRLGLQHAPAVTCHAVTEDSAPYDCTYIRGAWVRR